MLTASFPIYAQPVDTTLPRKCETCSLWQHDVTTTDKKRSRCACPVPASVNHLTKYSNYTYPTDGEHCLFWHPSQRKLQEHKNESVSDDHST